jgi:hypothetical protein
MVEEEKKGREVIQIILMNGSLPTTQLIWRPRFSAVTNSQSLQLGNYNRWMKITQLMFQIQLIQT